MRAHRIHPFVIRPIWVALALGIGYGLAMIKSPYASAAYYFLGGFFLFMEFIPLFFPTLARPAYVFTADEDPNDGP